MSEQATLPIAFDGRVSVAKDFSIKALIPAKPTGKPVTVYGWCPRRKAAYVAKIGGVSKNHEDVADASGVVSLHVDLWQLILVLLSLWQERDLGSNFINPGFNEVWRRFANKGRGEQNRPSSGTQKRFRQLWDELDALKMLVSYPGEGNRWVDVVEYETVNYQLNTGGYTDKAVRSFRFHESFLEVVRYAHEVQDVRLDVLGGISSAYVRAAYLWLPSMAFRVPTLAEPLPANLAPIESETRSAAISSSDLLSKLGMVITGRADRKKFLTQNKASILQQLHGLPLLRPGLAMGVTAWDGPTDFTVGVYTYSDSSWVAPTSPRARPQPARDTKLFRAFVERGGGDPAAFMYWLNSGPLPKLDPYHVERMGALGIPSAEIEQSLTFFRMAVALIGPDEFKAAIGWLSEARSVKKPGGWLRTRILDRIAELAKQRSVQHAHAIAADQIFDTTN